LSEEEQKMTRLHITGFAVALLGSPLLATADDFDGSKPLLCASVDVIECAPGDGCQRVSAAAIDAPEFFRLDVGKKQIISSRGGADGRTSTIERSETVEGKLILQGAEEGREDVRDGLGWTLSIAQDSGRMVLTASGEDAAFVIFGNCLAF